MPDTKRLTLSGWGCYPMRECLCWRPEKQRDVERILEKSGPALPRGLGRSYGDASLQPDGVMLTERLNHFIAFDHTQGIVSAQAGVTLAEVMDLAIPLG